METSIRHINCRYPHPAAPTEFEVLWLDDGFTSVVRSNTLPPVVRCVKVSGADITVRGVRSFGDVVLPCTVVENHTDPPRRSGKCALSDCFHGLQVGMYMWGRKGSMTDLATTTDETLKLAEIDRTRMVFEEGDILACVTANEMGTIFCFNVNGEEIKDWGFRKPARMRDLKNYYAFCGILSADRAKYTTHCVWNVQRNTPVGPPYDRRIAKFVDLDFAPTEDDLFPCEAPIMCRVDSRMPIVICPEDERQAEGGRLQLAQ